MNVLITGATGFVGRFLCERLLADGLQVRGTLLGSESSLSLVEGVEPVIIQLLGPDTIWVDAVAGIDTVIHLAARVHIMDDPAADPRTEFHRVNVEGTLKLARDAVSAGVRRLVFISSIKVNGEETVTSYTSDSPTHPSDPYGISKWEAEQGLQRIESETGLEVVIVRPTLVYGPGVKANFLNMMKIISRGIPLPLASITNKRSLIYVGNLADALATCATHSEAAGKTYLVSDGEDVSTPGLIRKTALALGVSARLFPFPAALLRFAGKMTGKSCAVDRLIGSLAVDSSIIQRDLGWVPPFTMEEGLGLTAEWFNKQEVCRDDFMKRTFDFMCSLLAVFFLAIPMLIVALAVKFTSLGPILYWSDRVGKNNVIFKMPKFRTMRVDTPAVATHLLGDPDRWLTPIGKFLRKSSLDELPQLFSILIGDMSIVGPRPALFNQVDLIDLRTKKGIHHLNPGLTGWAQINGRDELPIPAKVTFDEYYLHNHSFFLDIKIIFLTFIKVVKHEGVTH